MTPVIVIFHKRWMHLDPSSDVRSRESCSVSDTAEGPHPSQPLTVFSWCPANRLPGWLALSILIEGDQTADEPPAAAEFAERQHQLVPTLFQRKVNRVVLRIHNSEEPGGRGTPGHIVPCREFNHLRTH